MSGNLTMAELKADTASGKIDTVLACFTDMQGRLVGKRASARLFLEELAHHGAECCNYLLAVDVDMNTVLLPLASRAGSEATGAY
jgi:glutamine synthetase